MSTQNQLDHMPRRCQWCTDDALYVQYHDEEWGVPIFEPQALFERLVLEGMQAGLSWFTILKKRAHMQSAFYDFDRHKIAAASDVEMARWLNDAGIIRHRGKLSAMINNAKLSLAQDDFSGLLWSFAPMVEEHDPGDAPSATPASEAMSKSLKAKGYKFVGPTICYAFMQSVGMVNDHHPNCWRFRHCETLHGQALAGVA